mmetsp:Transcript_9304/g.28161  ORF Transcript_9304/g.28161 Transcript_9304/m.28161 type:complete len:194 (+) Transcript_9304:543-1124(+)|eukprot:scaffold101442_cov30-Tisochrysis_lutea.AAC.2
MRWGACAFADTASLISFAVVMSQGWEAENLPTVKGDYLQHRPRSGGHCIAKVRTLTKRLPTQGHGADVVGDCAAHARRAWRGDSIGEQTCKAADARDVCPLESLAALTSPRLAPSPRATRRALCHAPTSRLLPALSIHIDDLRLLSICQATQIRGGGEILPDSLLASSTAGSEDVRGSPNESCSSAVCGRINA